MNAFYRKSGKKDSKHESHKLQKKNKHRNSKQRKMGMQLLLKKVVTLIKLSAIPVDLKVFPQEMSQTTPQIPVNDF